MVLNDTNHLFPGRHPTSPCSHTTTNRSEAGQAVVTDPITATVGLNTSRATDHPYRRGELTDAPFASPITRRPRQDQGVYACQFQSNELVNMADLIDTPPSCASRTSRRQPHKYVLYEASLPVGRQGNSSPSIPPNPPTHHPTTPTPCPTRRLLTVSA